MAGAVAGRLFVRDRRGIIHGATLLNGRIHLTCCEGEESADLRLVPGLPENIADGALCYRNWPRRSTDIPAGEQ